MTMRVPQALTPAEQAELRRLLEECEVLTVSDSIRSYVERYMPDLVDRLPPRVLH
jgi:hypothetical protein